MDGIPWHRFITANTNSPKLTKVNIDYSGNTPSAITGVDNWPITGNTPLPFRFGDIAINVLTKRSYIATAQTGPTFWVFSYDLVSLPASGTAITLTALTSNNVALQLGTLLIGTSAF